jgi:hypothetical protein
MFFKFFTKLMRIFGLACRLLLITGLLMLYVLPFQVVSANTSGTSSSNQGTNNQSVLGTVLPACASAARGVNLLLECAKQVTLAILVVGIIFVFIRIGYESAVGLVSGGASAANIKQIQDLLGSLIVGIVLVGMPALIIQSIDPLGGRVAFNSLQEINLGPDAQLKLFDKDLDVAGCGGLKLCVDSCPPGDRNLKDVNCVTVCKTRNFGSTEPCSKECRDKITDDGDISEFSECVKRIPKEQSENIFKYIIDHIIDKFIPGSGNSNNSSGNNQGS